jgi:uncharacterized protein
MGEAEPDSLIVIVAKAPQVGKVKTRLCPPLSPIQAAALYTGFLLDTVELALKVPGVKVKAVCPTTQAAQQLRGILPEAVSYIVQHKPGLTAALTEGFEAGLAAGYSKVLCISSDNPTLPVQYLKEALQALETNELALGPTEDGGYYLIGAKKVYPFLLNDMTWSTPTVLSETLNRAIQNGLQVQVLPGWYDLDTIVELERFRVELDSLGNYEAFHTRQALSSLSVEQLG